MKRLLLVRHAATSATRAAAFPADEALEAGAAALAAPLAGLMGERTEVLASPARRCAETAAAAGLAPRVEPRIAECDFGVWAGRTLASVHGEDPDAVAAWIADPAAAPHGGESLAAFAARVGDWLDEQAASGGSVLAITHGGVVRSALVHALGAPLEAFWRIDVVPLSVTELHAHDGRWTVSRTNGPVGAAGRADAGRAGVSADPTAAGEGDREPRGRADAGRAGVSAAAAGEGSA